MEERDGHRNGGSELSEDLDDFTRHNLLAFIFADWEIRQLLMLKVNCFRNTPISPGPRNTCT